MDATHKAFICTISFYEPNSGPIRILAKDEAHARELLPQMLVHVKDLKILDVVAEESIKLVQPSDDTEEPPKENLH